LKKLLLVIILISALTALLANDLLQTTLKNGMQIVVKENKLNESVGFYCFVKTGSVNEGKYLGAGISHYLEHVVSSGTTKFHTEDEYNQMGKEMGAIVNAYTNQFATAFYITVDKAYKDMALQNLSEQMQACVCDSFEVAREREVILKEIVMRSTPPRSKVYQRHSELVFPNSNKRYPVIGYTDLYKTITRDELQDYYKARYAPNNMVFVAVGDFEAEEMLEKVKASFKDFPRKQIEPVYQPTQHQREGTIEYTEEFEIESPSVYMTTILSSEDYVDVTALDVALNVLFAKRQSPIRYKLVEELELVNSRGLYAYASGVPASPEGEITIQFEPKRAEDIDKIISIIDKEIMKYSSGGFTEDNLQNYINRVKAQKLLRMPGVSSDANNIGWTMMLFNIPDHYPIEMQILEKLTVDDLSAQLRKHLVPKNRVIFKAVPQGTKAMLEKSEVAAIEKTDIQKVKINDELTLLYKMNTEKPIINAVIYLPITTNYETEENAGALSFMIDMMLRGSKKYSSLEISEWQEDHAVSLNASCSRTGTMIQFKCLKADFDHFKEMLFDAFNDPSFEPKELNLAKEEVKASFNRAKSRASTAHNDYVKTKLYSNQRAELSREAKTDIVLGLSRKDLKELHKTYFNSNELIVTLFGDLTEEEAENIAMDIKKNMPDKKIKAEKSFNQISSEYGNFTNKYNFEQVNVDIYCNAPLPGSDEFYTMNLINMLLWGSRGRLHLAVRGTNNLAYFAFPDYTYSENSSYFNLSSQTSIDKKDELIEVMLNELDKLMNEDVSVEEIDGAIDESSKMMQAMFNDNNLPYYITRNEASGLGYNYLVRLKEIYGNITPAQIKAVANKYFKNRKIITSVPDENVDLMVD